MISDYSAEDLYNGHSEEYSHSKDLPFRWVESYNFMKLFKDILLEAKTPIHTVLDVACGNVLPCQNVYQARRNQAFHSQKDSN